MHFLRITAHDRRRSDAIDTLDSWCNRIIDNFADFIDITPRIRSNTDIHNRHRVHAHFHNIAVADPIGHQHSRHAQSIAHRVGRLIQISAVIKLQNNYRHP